MDKNTSLSYSFILKHGQQKLQFILRVTFSMLQKKKKKLEKSSASSIFFSSFIKIKCTSLEF